MSHTTTKTIPDSKLSDSTNEGKTEDQLNVDASIPGQQFVCLSFLSPEKILKQKEAFMRTEFWKHLKESHDSIDFNLVNDFENLYENFMDTEGQRLEESFHEQCLFQPTVRGLKVRGTYNTRQEAEVRSKVLQKLDSSHNVFVAPVGYWLPWDPSENAIEDQVYQEEQLNELMQNYKQNEIKRDTFYEEQKEERKKAMIEENDKRKQEQKAEKENKTTGNTSVAASATEKLMEAVQTGPDHAELKAEYNKFKAK